MKFYILLSVFITSACASFINPYPRFKAYNDGGDPGKPLYLTPFIKNGSKEAIQDALQAAKVSDGQFTFVESYAGYLTVNEALKSNMFFWYFPPEESKSPYAPIILWLQGGPGASSLFGLFTENGPFIISNGTLNPRKYSWTKNHHVIYIDNPVGTGFSFTNDEGYVKNEKEVGRDLYKAILQLFTLFEIFKDLDFWIAGESYAGKYVPALAFTIYNKKLKMAKMGLPEKVPIKLKGIAIGNGLSDPLHQLHYGDYLYQIGLIDYNASTIFHSYEAKAVKCIKANDMDCAFKNFDHLMNIDKSAGGSLFQNLTGFNTYFNYLRTSDGDIDQSLAEFVQSSKTRKAIHVGNNTFHDLDDIENKVEIKLKDDIMDTVAPWIAQLLEVYKVCIYNGQLDIIVAYPLTESYLQKLKFSAAGIYRTAPRNIWRIDDKIAGYVKEAGNLVEILVRNAGHMAPADQPMAVFDMITRCTHNKPFY